MRIIKNIENFLLDQEYYIDLYKNCLHIYSYQDLLTITDTLIKVKLVEFIFLIKGSNLVLNAMDNKELLIKGKFTSLEFIYE